MDNFFLINFEDFSPLQMCSFVTERVHKKLEEKLLYLNNVILTKSVNSSIIITNFHQCYINLVDQITRLIQLEQKILFHLIAQQTDAQLAINIPEKSISLVKQYQSNIKSSLLHCRTLYQDQTLVENYSTLGSIIEYELLNVEHQITQWFYIVNKNILSCQTTTK